MLVLPKLMVRPLFCAGPAARSTITGSLKSGLCLFAVTLTVADPPTGIASGLSGALKRNGPGSRTARHSERDSRLTAGWFSFGDGNTRHPACATRVSFFPLTVAVPDLELACPVFCIRSGGQHDRALLKFRS